MVLADDDPCASSYDGLCSESTVSNRLKRAAAMAMGAVKLVLLWQWCEPLRIQSLRPLSLLKSPALPSLPPGAALSGASGVRH